METADIKLELTSEHPGKDIPSPNTDSGVVLESPNTTPTEEQPNINMATATQGPDTVIDTENIMTWHRDEAVKIQLTTEGPASSKPLSIPTVFADTVKKLPNHPALAVKRDKQWKQWTYQEYSNDVMKVAKAFIKLGLEPYHGVGIIGFNSPEWFISDLAAIHAGGFAVGIYTTNSADACHYVAENCEANIVVVENDQQLQKMLKVRSRLPHLKAIIQYEGKPKEKYDNVYTWEELLNMSKDMSDDVVKERYKAMAPNKCCTLIYTSGTTGNPKGVMLSHDNLLWTAKKCGDCAKLTFGNDHLVSYLPLSHVAAQLLDIYIPFVFGGTVHFAQPDALKGSLGQTLKEVRPTAFLGVPRVWEKMQEKMMEVAKQGSSFRKSVARWAKGVGLTGNMNRMNGGSVPFGWTLANMLVFKKVRLALGLDRCRFCFTGAAPIMRETLDFFLSLDIPLLELYGMSECSAPHTISLPDKFRVGSVGVEFPGATTKLDGVDNEGNGEICMAGRHVFMGYINMEEKTKEALDDEGWLHSGDIGRKDKEGFLFITGRIKELIITAGGENVAPVPIEDTVKEELHIISNCMLIGDKKKFLAILLTLKTEVDEATMMPTDKLTAAAIEWCRSVGSEANTLSDILDKKDKTVLTEIQKGIDRANAKSISRAQKVQKWSILPRDFSIPGGELGPTLKLKRPVVTTMYTNTIDAFYNDGGE